MHEERKTKLPEFFSDPVTWIALRDTDTGDWIVCSKHRHATKQEATDAITVLAARQQAREAIDLALHLDVNEHQYVELAAAYEALPPEDPIATELANIAGQAEADKTRKIPTAWEARISGQFVGLCVTKAGLTTGQAAAAAEALEGWHKLEDEFDRVKQENRELKDAIRQVRESSGALTRRLNRKLKNARDRVLSVLDVATEYRKYIREHAQDLEAIAAMKRHSMSVVQVHPNWRACVMGLGNEGVIGATHVNAVLSLAAQLEQGEGK